jgi:outer membrane protease
MRRLAFLPVFLVLAGAASADGLDSAVLRGSSGFEVPVRGAPVFAADAPYYPLDDEVPVYAPVAPPVVTTAHELSIEIGGRFWYSTGRFQKNLFDDPRFSNNMVSRLTYNALSAHSYELFARVEHASGFFLKGYGGLGSIITGTLTDEDFPPGIIYSNTLSDQRSGTLGYVTVDFGYDVFRTPTYRVGPFVGYNYTGERLNAYGCTQTSANPDICVPTIPSQVLGITEDSGLHSIRLGIAADVLLFDCLRLGADAAWVPYAVLNSTDTHWLRADISGPINEPATANGFQVEAFASYQMNPAFSIGAGVRYWYWNATGKIELEQQEGVGGLAMAQPGTFNIQRYGYYAQAAYKFGVD